MVGSASPVISIVTYHSPWTIFFRQVLWMVVGVGALLIFARVDYRTWRKLAVPLLVVTLGLLVAVLVPGLGVHAPAARRRWIGFGLLRIQPSELMKLALAVFAADIVVEARRTGRHRRSGHRPGRSACWSWPAPCILKQPDMGTALVLACITFGSCSAAGCRWAP